jgi:hypothetical protein
MLQIFIYLISVTLIYAQTVYLVAPVSVAFYEKIVEAADEHCPMTSASYYKHYWDDQLNDLKHKSKAAHDMW